MRKFITIAAILLVVGLVVARNTRVSSYVCTAAKNIQKHMQANISPEFEIERLDMEIERLKGDVNDLVNQEAVLSVDLSELKQNLESKEKTLAKSEETLLAFANKVKENSNSNFQFVSHTYTPVAAKKKLADDYELYQSQKASVKSMRNLVTAREQQLTTLRNQRQKIVTQQATYKAKLDQLAADWTLLKNEVNSSPASVDNNRFKSIEEGLKQLNRQVEIEKRKADIHGENHSISGGAAVEVGPQIDPDFVLNAIRNPGDEKTIVGTTNGQK